MAESMKGSITLSCGHLAADPYDGEMVRYRSEVCDAVDGFKPCIVYAEYCPACASALKASPEYLPSEAAADRWLDSLP